MQPTLSDPINDTTAVAAGRRRRALAPIRNDISERGRGREREKYNDGDDKSQVGLMIERKEEGREEKRKWEIETS